MNVPGARRDLHLFESRCHPGASRKAKSPERVAPCSAPHAPHPTLPHSTLPATQGLLKHRTFQKPVSLAGNQAWNLPHPSRPPRTEGHMRCYSTKCPLGVTTTCTDAHLCELLFFPCWSPLLLSLARPLAPPNLLGNCMVDGTNHGDPSWLFWTDSKLANKLFLVTNLPPLQSETKL